MKKRMFMALAVALTGVSMVVAAGNGELKIQSEASVQKVHAAEIHQIGVEPIPATGQITIEDLLAVQGGETEDPRAVEGMSDPEDVPVDEASVEDTNADEYASLAIANVTNYVNVRTEPNTDSTVVGKIYDGAVAQILDVAGEDQDWFRIISGNVEGYIKAEFFIYGDAAAEVVDNYVTRYAVVIADRLNVRQDPATDAKRIGYIDNGEKVKILENDGDWLKVQYTDSKEGYVSAEYVTISEEFIYAKTIEEEQAEIAAQKALQAREQTAEQDAPEVITNITLPTTTYTSNAESLIMPCSIWATGMYTEVPVCQEVQIVPDSPALSMRSSAILSAVHREDSIPVPDAVSVLKNFSQEILYVIVPMEGRAVPM